MRAMLLRAPGDVATRPLAAVERAVPEPGPGEVLVRVEVCGVCRTDLHVVEGELAPQRAEIVPGHQIVGRVERCGEGVAELRPGDRVGVAWLHRVCGVCRFCARGDENLCLDPRFTGWHVDGGFAEYALAPADFVYALDASLAARDVAPLLCAGIIGYRAFARSRVRPGGRLGLWGFGASAHIVIQIARHHGCAVFAFSRAAEHAEFARALGATWTGGSFDVPPALLDAAIVFAPAGELVPAALERLDRGGTLALAGIHMSDVPPLAYQRHLFQERTVTSVTANTRADGRALLALAAAIPIRTATTVYPLDRANEALLDLKQDRIRGAAVLAIGGSALGG
jgi:propanol-preferring alcohol dehydrogenase